MIPKQGLLLKFNQKFKQIANNLETGSPKVDFTSDSTTPVVVTDDVQSYPSPSPVSDKPSQKPLKEEIIKDQSKIHGRFRGDAKLTGWQEAVNAAALKIALKSPNKMYDRASSDLQKKQAKHLTYMARKTTSSSSRATATATATSTVSATKVDIRSFLRVKTASDPNQDDCKESAEVASKKRRLDFKDITDKSIVVGVEVADDEKIGGEMVEINRVKGVPCVVLQDKPVSDKNDDEKSEMSGVKVASCAMVGDEVADNKKTSEEKDKVSGVKGVTCANVGDEVVDNEKTSEESGIKIVSSSASSGDVVNHFL